MFYNSEISDISRENVEIIERYAPAEIILTNCAIYLLEKCCGKAYS